MSSCSGMKILFLISTHIHIFMVSQSSKEISTAISWKTGVAIIEVEIGHIDEFNILYGSNFSTAIQRELALKFIYMMDGSTATYYMNNSKFVFVIKEADRASAEAFYRKIVDAINSMYFFKCFKFEFDIYAACLILKDYDGDTSTVISKVEYTLTARRNFTALICYFSMIWSGSMATRI